MASKRSKSSGATRAVQFLQQRGIAHALHEYPFDPADLGIGAQAAAALDVEPTRLFKTLMVKLDEQRLAVALVPVDAETNLKKLASSLGGKRAAMAAVAEAERASGYVKGGISPFGQRRPAPVAADTSILDHETVFVNGGRRGLQIELAPDDLIEALDATLTDLAR